MNIILLLAPFSVVLGLIAVGAFVWTLRAGQYDDVRGAAERILIDDVDPDVPGSGDRLYSRAPPDISDPQLDEVAVPGLRVPGGVEHRQVPDCSR